MKKRLIKSLTLAICCVLFVSLGSSLALAGGGKGECEGDVNGDGFVGILDLLEVISAWGECPEPPEECPADLDGDGLVIVPDLLIVLANFGPCDGQPVCESDADCDDGNDCTIDICIAGVCADIPIPDCE